MRTGSRATQISTGQTHTWSESGPASHFKSQSFGRRIQPNGPDNRSRICVVVGGGVLGSSGADYECICSRYIVCHRWAPRLTTNRPLRTGALARLFIRNLEPPYRLRFKVLAPLVPRQHDFNSAWGAFQESQAQLAKTIRSAAGLAIDQVRIKSPVYGRFSYNVYGALRMLAAHERRHLWQIEQILEALDDAKIRKAS